MNTLFLIDDELMVELSENAQEHIQGGSINFYNDQKYSAEAFGLAAVNGANGSGVVVYGTSISSDQKLDLHI